MFSVLLAPVAYAGETSHGWMTDIHLTLPACGTQFSGARGTESLYHCLTLAASDGGGYPHESDWSNVTTPLSSNGERE